MFSLRKDVQYVALSFADSPPFEGSDSRTRTAVHSEYFGFSSPKTLDDVFEGALETVPTVATSCCLSETKLIASCSSNAYARRQHFCSASKIKGKLIFLLPKVLLELCTVNTVRSFPDRHLMSWIMSMWMNFLWIILDANTLTYG